MIAIVYTDEGPSGPGGQTTDATRSHQGVYLFDTPEEARTFLDERTPIRGRKRPKVLIIDTDNGDAIKDHRNARWSKMRSKD